MALKKLYDEAKSDKMNEASGPETYSMPLEDMLEEHVELIKILRSGSRDELLKEADDQEKELEGCLKQHGMKMSDVRDAHGDYIEPDGSEESDDEN